MLRKDYNHHSLIIQYSIFHKNFQRIYGRKDNHSFIAVQKYMSILPIAAPHMEEIILEAATKKRLFRIREHCFAKFHENVS